MIRKEKILTITREGSFQNPNVYGDPTFKDSFVPGIPLLYAVVDHYNAGFF
jgi:hypothetical protein